jgi:hypothetical protein
VPFAKKESAGISRGFKVEASMSHLERRGREGIAALMRFDSSDALTLIPPAMSSDDEWHEVRAAKIRPERTGAEQFAGLEQCRDVTGKIPEGLNDEQAGRPAGAPRPDPP